MGVGWCEQLAGWQCCVLPVDCTQLGLLQRADALLPLLHMATRRAAGGGDVGVN